MQNPRSIIDNLKPFLKENVDVRFKEFDGWQDLVLSMDDKALVLTATGDEGGYYNMSETTFSGRRSILCLIT